MLHVAIKRDQLLFLGSRNILRKINCNFITKKSELHFFAILTFEALLALEISTDLESINHPNAFINKIQSLTTRFIKNNQ
jgi:hypothetical protein